MSCRVSDFVTRAAAVLAGVAFAFAALPATPVAIEAQEEMSQVERTFSDLSYRNVGPSRGGRVTAVAAERLAHLSFPSASSPDIGNTCWMKRFSPFRLTRIGAVRP